MSKGHGTSFESVCNFSGTERRSKKQRPKKAKVLLKQSVLKTTNFFHKTFQRLNGFFCFGKEYQRLPKGSLPSPFSGSHGSSKCSQTRELSADFGSECESNLQKAKKRTKNDISPPEQKTGAETEKRTKNDINPPEQKTGAQNASCEGSTRGVKPSSAKHKPEETVKQERKTNASRLREREEETDQNRNRSCHALAQKMKVLDMIELGDVEHAHDVQEALQCYAQLRNSVYLDIVDRFFMHMYCEFSHPRESATINTSSRRFRSSRF